MVMRSTGNSRGASKGKPGPVGKGPRVQITTRLPEDLHEWLTEGQKAGRYGDFNDHLTAFLEAARKAGVQAPSVPQPEQLPLSA